MIKVFVFVSGLTLASLPIGSDGEPIVFAFPDAMHRLTVIQGAKVAGGSPFEVVPGVPATNFELSLVKDCSPGKCPPSAFPLKELYLLADLTEVAGGASSAVRPECSSAANVMSCVAPSGGRRLLAGTLRVSGDWRLAALSDCKVDQFPHELSTAGREVFVDPDDTSQRKPSSPRVLADAFRLQTEVVELGTALTFKGFPKSFSLHESAPELCRMYGEGASRCALLFLRYEPVNPQPGDLAEHFRHLYDLMASPPSIRWSPFLSSGKYCGEKPFLGGGHPRCLGGYVAY